MHDRGIAYYEKHDFDHAIADFEAAIKINPNYTVAARPRGEDRAPSAATTATPAEPAQPIQVSPIFALAYNDRGISFASKNDSTTRSPTSIAPSRSIRTSRPPITIAATPISRSATIDRAVANYDAAIRLNPKDAMAYYDRGVARYEREDYDQRHPRFRPGDAARSEERGRLL